MNNAPIAATWHRRAWQWAVPVIALSGMAVVAALDANQWLFLWLNAQAALLPTALWANITLLGDATVTLSLLLLFAGRRPDVVWTALLAAILASLWVHGLKLPLGVERPAAVLPPDSFHIIGPLLERRAFPSGHTTSAFVLAGVVCLQRWPVSIRAAILALATLVGLSRIAVGAHWPLDVLGGAFGGWTAAVLGQWLARRWPWGEGPRAQLVWTAVLVAAALWLLFGHDARFAQARAFQYGIALVCLAVAAQAGLRRLSRKSPD